MKLIAIFLVISATSACATKRDYDQMTKQVGEYGLQVYEDKARGNTCYLYRDDDSPALSCVRTKK